MTSSTTSSATCAPPLPQYSRKGRFQLDQSFTAATIAAIGATKSIATPQPTLVLKPRTTSQTQPAKQAAQAAKYRTAITITIALIAAPTGAGPGRPRAGTPPWKQPRRGAPEVKY